MPKTVEEIEELKKDWESDPCWDLYETECFEEHREELKAFQENREAEWAEERKQREKEIDAEAEKLGVRGLYRLLIKRRELLDTHEDAITALANGDSQRAYKILKGYED